MSFLKPPLGWYRGIILSFCVFRNLSLTFHWKSPPNIYPFFLLVSLKLSLCAISKASLELVSIGLTLHLLLLTLLGRFRQELHLKAPNP